METKMVEESERIERVLLMEEAVTERVRSEQPETGRLDARAIERITSLAELMEIEENGAQKLVLSSAEAETAENNGKLEGVLLVEEKSTEREELAAKGTVKMTTSMEKEGLNEKKLAVPLTERRMERGEPIIVETWDTRGHPEMTGLEKMEDLVIYPTYPDQTIKVGQDISAAERSEIIKLLQDSHDDFAWVMEDMQGVDRRVL